MPRTAATSDAKTELHNPPHRRNVFFANVDWSLGSDLESAKYITGQMYVESLKPIVVKYQFPVVLIHGDYHTGQIWTDKPDGKPGWAAYFLREGFHVYLVDLPPSGRSNYLTGGHLKIRDDIGAWHKMEAPVVERELTAPETTAVDSYPNAKLHNKWPGTGVRGCPIFQNYCAGLVNVSLDRFERQILALSGLGSLLKDHIAPAHAADATPEYVAGIVAVEPAGPPFGVAYNEGANGVKTFTPYLRPIKDETGLALREYGLADICLSYDPPPYSHFFQNQPLDLVDKLREPGHDGRCVMQRGGPPDSGQIGPRKLWKLAAVPHAVVTAPASPHSVFDWMNVAFMRQAGMDVDVIKLEHSRITGNGHLMFLETNSDKIAKLIQAWISSKTNNPVTAPAAKKTPQKSRAAAKNTRATRTGIRAMNESILLSGKSSSARPGNNSSQLALNVQQGRMNPLPLTSQAPAVAAREMPVTPVNRPVVGAQARVDSPIFKPAMFTTASFDFAARQAALDGTRSEVRNSWPSAVNTYKHGGGS